MNSEEIARQWKFALLMIIVLSVLSVVAWPFVAVRKLFKKRQKDD